MGGGTNSGADDTGGGETSDTAIVEQAVPQTLTKVSGDEQDEAAGATLADPFVISVLDQNGNPFAGAAVTFAVTSGKGTLSIPTTTTDANGRATSILTLGIQLGINTVKVMVTVADLVPEIFTVIGNGIPPSPDFNGNGIVDIPDFLLFVEVFGSRYGGEKYEMKYDLNVNGEIGSDDFLIFLDSFGKTVN